MGDSINSCTCKQDFSPLYLETKGRFSALYDATDKVNKGLEEGSHILVNAAINKSAISNSVMGLNVATYAVDGNLENYYHSNTKAGVWLMIDLEAVYFVKEIRFYGRAYWAGRRGHLKVFI